MEDKVSFNINSNLGSVFWSMMSITYTEGSMGRGYFCKNLYSIVTREKFLLKRVAIITSCFLYCVAAVWLTTNFKAGAWLDAGSENKLQDFS